MIINHASYYSLRIQSTWASCRQMRLCHCAIESFLNRKSGNTNDAGIVSRGQYTSYLLQGKNLILLVRFELKMIIVARMFSLRQSVVRNVAIIACEQFIS